jgi:uncharacterized protein YkwD
MKKTLLAFTLITALFGCTTGNSAAVFAQTTPERRVFELINIERQKENLDPYRWFVPFSSISRAHSEDMLRNNFLGERGSDGTVQGHWFERIGIDDEVNYFSFLMVYRGNNTPEQMLAEWMRNNSDRAKILSENNIVGVGIVPRPAGSADRNVAYWTVLIGSFWHPLIVGEKPRYPNIPMASVSSRYRYALAVRGDGTLWSWGQNFYGELGNGSHKARFYPAQVSAASNWASVCSAVENGVSLGIKTDGTLWAWGCNELGQLGLAAMSRRNPTPIKIGTDTDWKSLSLGDSFTVAIKTDGSV